MIAREYISEKSLCATGNLSVTEMLELMTNNQCKVIPVVDETQFKGVIYKTDIVEIKADIPLNSIDIEIFKPYYVFEDEHIFEAIRQIATLSMCMIPVLDRKKRWIGNIAKTNIVEKIDQLIPITIPGGIIVLEVEKRDYSLKEIAHIVEMNDATILSANAIQHPKKINVLVLTIKINKVDLTAIIQNFLRYEYVIKAHFSQNEKLTEKIKNRYEMLMRYLEV